MVCMKKAALLLSGCLVLGGVAQAQAQASQTTARTAAQSFGNPRSSTTDGVTKVVFDLPENARYSFSPSTSGLIVRVENVPILTENRGSLGASVQSYRATRNGAVLSTPFALSETLGWRADETVSASTGGRVLILEIGLNMQGGANNARLLGLLPSSMPAALHVPPTSVAQTAGAQALAKPIPIPRPVPTPAPVVSQAPAPVALPPATVAAAVAAATQSGSADAAPGDTVGVAQPEPLPAELAEAAGYTQNSDMSGRVPGNGRNSVLGAPRFGHSPGMTRLVLDLPAGATYNIQPRSGALAVNIGNVQPASMSQSGVSSEVLGWSYRPVSGGLQMQVSAQNLSAQRGWRAFFLPPAPGSNSHRLAIDFAPALANLRPLPRAQSTLARLSYPNSGGLAYASSLRPRVVLDPGHGGKDPGAVGQIQEKNVVLDVSRRTREFLAVAGVDVVMTRNSDMHLHPDKATDLRMRSNMGGRGVLFVSVHANAMPRQNALRGYGIETWYNANHRYSPALATILQKNMLDVSGAHSRGVKNSQTLGVLRANPVPAALVEVGFISHPVDSLNLQDDNYVDRVAFGLARGIHESIRAGVHGNPGASMAVADTDTNE